MSAPQSNSKREVIEILDDDSTEDDKEDRKPRAKRAISESEETEASAVKAKRHAVSVSTSMQASPIVLFATDLDREERRKHSNRQHWSWTQCLTLREMLGFDANPAVNHPTSIEWLVMANYLVDIQLLLNEVPEIVSIPRVVAFCGVIDDPLGVGQWKSACADADQLDVITLSPSDPVGVTNPLDRRIPFGVHHSKIFLIGRTGSLRVIIHTANMRYADIHLKAQSAYIQDFPLKTSHSPTDEFEDSLVSYFETYKYHKKHIWRGSSKKTLTECLREYDFSSASVVLLASTPGYHPLNDTEKLGHLKLRSTVSQKAAPGTKSPASIICQFSSMGSLTEKYLRDLETSMNSDHPNAQQNLGSTQALQLKLVFPTVSEIRNSIEGYRGGGTVPGPVKNVSKPFLQSLYHKWSTSGPSPNPQWKGRNVPHIKTYFRQGEDGSFDWFVVSSHNLSKAAWGEVQTSARLPGRRLFIRHWELGVFLSPKTLKVKKLVPWSPELARGSDVATVPLPYNASPEPYGRDDQPWAWDQSYDIPDRYGRRSLRDP